MEEHKVEEVKEEVPVAETKAKDVKEDVVVVAAEECSKPEEGKAEEVKKEEVCAETEEKAEGEPHSEPLSETGSFKEESYSVGDLTDAEKKALEAFRQKVEEAIKSKSILKNPKKKVEEKVVAELPSPLETETHVPEGEPPAAKEREVMAEEITAATEEPVAAPPASNEPPADLIEVVAEKKEILIKEPQAIPVEGPENFYIWGIPIHEGDDKTDALLIKFLRAHNFKVDDTLSMIKSTVKWRKEFNVEEIEEEEVEGQEEFEKWAFLYGKDKEGHPVCYNRNVFQNKEACEKVQFGKFLRWRVQMMEKSIKHHLDFGPGGVHSFLQVIDLQNSPGLLKGAQAMKKLLSLLHDNYPELAAKQIVLNMPWWYYPPLYRVFRLEPKVVWGSPGKSTETLLKYIAADQMPVEYGGLGRPNDLVFEGVEAPVTCITLKAGEKHEVELPIEEVGSTLVWDISVVGGDVVYGEEFVPSTYTVIIRKPKKLPASTEPFRNSFKAMELGKVVITIDNSTSKKKKTVIYRSTIKEIASK